MANVVGFPASPLAPFLGEWLRDPISVSRRKVSRRILGPDGLKLLWDCESMAQVRERLEADPALAARYQARLKLGGEGRLTVSRRALVWHVTRDEPVGARERTYAIVEAACAGRKVMVRTDVAATGFALRMNKQWLLVSEVYHGRRAALFPPSPVFRYYRAG